MSATAAHLAGLVSRLPDGAGHVLVARRGNGLVRGWDQLVNVSTLGPAVDRVVQLEAEGLDVYVSTTATDDDIFAATRRRSRGARGGAVDSLYLDALWADIDVAGPGHKGTGALPGSIDEAVKVLDDLPRPSLTVCTGGGLHAWWWIDPVPADGTLTDRWVRLVAAQAADLGWAIDAGVGDLARVLRVAGTTNYKIHDEPRPVEILDNSGHLYVADNLARLLPAPAVPARPSTSTPGPSAGQRRPTVPTSSGTLNILDACDAAAWSEVWPSDWEHVGHETIAGEQVELWRRPGSASACSAKCWPSGACRLWSDQVPGLAPGDYSRAEVLAWRHDVRLSDLAGVLMEARGRR